MQQKLILTVNVATFPYGGGKIIPQCDKVEKYLGVFEGEPEECEQFKKDFELGLFTNYKIVKVTE